MARLANRGIFTLKQWCTTNGYPGVTKECMISAEGTGDQKLRLMVKEERILKISDRKGQK